MSSPESRAILRRPVASNMRYRSFMMCWKCSNAAMASVMDGPMNSSAQARHMPSSTCLPSTRISLQSQDSAPCATIRFSPDDLPAPGSPPSSMFRSARLTCTGVPYSSRPRCTGSNMENGKVGTGGSGRVSVAVMVASFGAGRWGGQPPDGICPGAAVPVSCGWVVLVQQVCDEGQFGAVLGAAGQALEGGCDELAGREGVAADDVDGDQVGPPSVAGDPGVAGVAGGAQLAGAGFEVLGADARPAQHPGAFADLGRPGPQDE